MTRDELTKRYLLKAVKPQASSVCLVLFLLFTYCFLLILYYKTESSQIRLIPYIIFTGIMLLPIPICYIAATLHAFINILLGRVVIVTYIVTETTVAHGFNGNIDGVVSACLISMPYNTVETTLLPESVCIGTEIHEVSFGKITWIRHTFMGRLRNV